MPISPLRPLGPPLNALRAFESAARLGGFTAAANELCVTPGAVSQQVKTLELWAGAALFERRSRGVSLTPLGEEVSARFTSAFDLLGGATRSLRAGSGPSTINIAVMPSVAQLWLSSRLPAIREALAGYKISISAMDSPPNLDRELFDLSIFLRQPSGRPSETCLLEDVLMPVCSPEISQRLKKPVDLLQETWLYDTTWLDDWMLWANRFLPELIRPKDGPLFSLYSIAVEEAKNGAGILVGHESLVADHLQSGELVAPFDKKITSGNFMVLETPQTTALIPAIADIAAILDHKM